MQCRLVKIIVTVLCPVLLAACGFHLREAIQIPIEYTPVSIEVPRQYREFNNILLEEMRRALIPLTENRADAMLLVRLVNVREQEELLTASATGSPLERELILEAKVYWEDTQGRDLLEPEVFTLNRTFVYDDTAVLAKRREAENLMRELERELSRRIILRLRQLGK